MIDMFWKKIGIGRGSCYCYFLLFSTKVTLKNLMFWTKPWTAMSSRCLASHTCAPLRISAFLPTTTVDVDLIPSVTVVSLRFATVHICRFIFGDLQRSDWWPAEQRERGECEVRDPDVRQRQQHVCHQPDHCPCDQWRTGQWALSSHFKWFNVP